MYSGIDFAMPRPCPSTADVGVIREGWLCRALSKSQGLVVYKLWGCNVKKSLLVPICLTAIACLVGTTGANAAIVLNWAYSQLDANAGEPLPQGGIFQDSKKVQVAAGTTSLTASVPAMVFGGFTSMATSTASSAMSFAGGVSGTFHLVESTLTAGQNYAFGSANVQNFVNFTVVGTAETITGFLNSGTTSGQSAGWGVGFNKILAGGGFVAGSIGATQPGSMGTLKLDPGTYTAYTSYGSTGSRGQVCAGTAPCFWNNQQNADYQLTFPNLTIASGFDAQHPVVPAPIPGSAGFRFSAAHSYQWFDPVVAAGYDFQTTDGSKFTQITGLPTGFADPFEIVADGVSLGLFGSDDGIDFVRMLGHGVSAFEIRGINPGIDPGSPTAFPIALAFDHESVDFTMTPAARREVGNVPEPASIALIGVALAGLAATRHRKS